MPGWRTRCRRGSPKSHFGIADADRPPISVPCSTHQTLAWPRSLYRSRVGANCLPGRARNNGPCARCASPRASSSTAAAAAPPGAWNGGRRSARTSSGGELRIRAELSVPRELQALVLNRELMDSMEKAVFDQYVEGVQTRIDTTTPPEMRWLVMFPKLSATELKTLRDGYGALSSYKPWLQQWLAGSAVADAGGAADVGRAAAGADDRAAPPVPAHGPGPARPGRAGRPGCGCSNARCRRRSAWPSTRSTCTRRARSRACSRPRRCRSTQPAAEPRAAASARLGEAPAQLGQRLGRRRRTGAPVRWPPCRPRRAWRCPARWPPGGTGCRPGRSSSRPSAIRACRGRCARSSGGCTPTPPECPAPHGPARRCRGTMPGGMCHDMQW